MKILVTGANGYVARSIIRGLSADHDVTGISRTELDLTRGRDVFEYFKDKYFDVLIHCAVVGGSRLKEDTPLVSDYNLLMYYNLLNCRASYHKLIHFGSGAEMIAKESPYGYSKSVIRRSVFNQEGFYNLRIFAVFDENELDTRFIKVNLINYINKRPIVIHQNKVMDFFYMKDLIALVKYYINNDKGLLKQIDCSYREHLDLHQIAKIINSQSDYSVPIDIQISGMADAYHGHYTQLPIEYEGLKKGISQVYNRLK